MDWTAPLVDTWWDPESPPVQVELVRRTLSLRFLARLEEEAEATWAQVEIHRSRKPRVRRRQAS